MHTETISDALWQLIRLLDRSIALKGSYLGGGTALALRKSDDLGFFVPEPFDATLPLQELRNAETAITVLTQTSRHTKLVIQSSKVDIIREQIAVTRPVKSIHPEIRYLKIADAVDIGRMKLLTIGSRGGKKDFVDLYCLTREKISLGMLIAQSIEENQGVRYSNLLFICQWALKKGPSG